MTSGWGTPPGGGLGDRGRGHGRGGYGEYAPSFSSRGNFAEPGRGSFRGRGGRPSGPFSPDPVSQIHEDDPRSHRGRNLMARTDRG
jgi:hypothetical protein